MIHTRPHQALTLNDILNGFKGSEFVSGYRVIELGASDPRVTAMAHRTLAHNASRAQRAE